MFVLNDDLSIHATRGDIVFFTVQAEQNGKTYTFRAGDLMRVKVYGKKNAKNVVLQKDFPIVADCTEVEIFLDENETKFGGVISKPTDFWYEVELNPMSDPQTIIGYDEDGPKVFKLFPEGADVPEIEITEEDIPFVDSELDLTSERPVQNQAATRAIVQLRAAFETLNAASVNMANSLALESARTDNLISGSTPDGAEVIDVRVRADGKVYASAGDATRAIDKDLTAVKKLASGELSVGATGAEYLVSDVNEWVEWEDGSTIEDYIADDQVTFPSAWNDWGMATPELTIDSDKLLRVEFDLTHSNNAGTYDIRVYIAGGLGTSLPFKPIYTLTEDGHYLLTFDTAYHSVYDGVDVKRVWIVQKSLSGATTSETVVRNVRVYQNSLADNGLPESAAEALVEHIKSSVGGTETAAEHYMVSPIGEKYVGQVDANGKFGIIPVFPEKALFLGNSLLLGFQEYGMAASEAGKDYYNLVGAAIRSKKAGYTASRLQANPWEGCTTVDAQNAYLNDTILPLLSEDLELVVVQLGDNVNTDAKKAVFAEGSINLLRFIRTKCPRARVAWVGAWYSDSNRQSAMQNSCVMTGCVFVNIWDLNTRGNQSAIGNTYTMANGTVNTITDAGVASHPGDEGMKAIANRILFALGISETESYYA